MPYFSQPPTRSRQQSIADAAEQQDVARINSVLTKYRHLDFVKRILMPDEYPAIDLGGGKKATHKMSWGEADGKYFVYPEVFHENGQLLDLSGNRDAAIQRALQKGEYIPMPSEDEADWFSRNYKLVWPKNKR